MDMNKEPTVSMHARSVLRIFLVSALLTVAGALAAAAQPLPLFRDDFGPKPLGGPSTPCSTTRWERKGITA